jgi:hypothetical protein
MYIYIPDDATEEETDEMSAWLWNRKFEQRYEERQAHARQDRS